jgi:hypothetical protein
MEHGSLNVSIGPARVLHPALNRTTRKRGEHFGETNPRKQRTAVWRNEPDSSAQHFSAPAGMIAATSQEDFEWTSEPPTD